jgi:membrane protease YdiL (CAAX protease family)
VSQYAAPQVAHRLSTDSVSQRSIAFELAGIGALTLMFVATFRVRPPYVDFVLAAAAVVLIIASAARSRRIWSLAPLARADASRQAWTACGAFTAIALVVLAATAVVVANRSDLRWQPRFSNWHLWLAVALYLPWALLQQYIFQFYLFGRLLRLAPFALAVPVTACAFAAVHFPRWPVMLVTLVAGAFWSLAYYRWRRLLPLAASHAILGAALHYWVFGHDLLEAWLPG